MSKCRQCNIEITDDTQVCPLCRCVVEVDEHTDNRYPNIRFRTQKLHFAVRIFLFVAIILEVLFVYLNYKFYHGILWSLITGAGFAYIYFIARFAILNDNADYRAKFLTLTFFGILYVILIDVCIGYHGWSVNFVLPGGLLFVDLAIVILMFVNRRNWQSYIMWQLFMILCSFVTIILYWVGVIYVPYLALAALGTSVFLFLGTLIIGDRRARVELKRRFHIR